MGDDYFCQLFPIVTYSPMFLIIIFTGSIWLICQKMSFHVCSSRGTGNVKDNSNKFNPILTGGPPPPPVQIRDCLVTAADRDTPFHDFFFQVLRIFWYQVCENRTIGRKVTWRFVLARWHKICPNSTFCICLCTKHMKITDFLKMH